MVCYRPLDVNRPPKGPNVTIPLFKADSPPRLDEEKKLSVTSVISRDTMTSVVTAALDRAIESLPRAYPGSGDAVAVVKDGVPIIRYAA